MNTFITAEVGVNHDGNYPTARFLIDVAKKCGANAVKFQYWQSRTFPELEDLRLSALELIDLKEHAESLDLVWFCTPFDIESFDFLRGLKMPIWKIPSNVAVWNNPELIDLIIKDCKGKKLFISTGLMRNSLIGIKVLEYSSRCYNIGGEPVIFHCISKYPTKPEEAYLHMIKDLKSTYYDYDIGLSDHSGLPEIGIASVCLGAKFIECHITPNKNLDGPDHKSSLDINQFSYMVSAIRNIEKAI